MKKLALIALLAISMGLVGCSTFTNPPNGGDGFVIPTNLPPHIVSNDLQVIEDYYEGDLTPGTNGSELTE